MNLSRRLRISTPLLALLLAASVAFAQAPSKSKSQTQIQHVLLISVDGMPAVDLLNKRQWHQHPNNGQPFCPAIAAMTTRMWSFCCLTPASNL
jgi:hypothetical protein